MKIKSVLSTSIGDPGADWIESATSLTDNLKLLLKPSNCESKLSRT